MRAGRMDRRIILRAPAKSQSNGYNAVTTTWPADTLTVWAERVYARGVEKYQASQIDANRAATYRIRYRDDYAIDETWQLADGDVTYDILGVLEIGRQVGIEINAIAHVATS